jgi:hypothetical protein
VTTSPASDAPYTRSGDNAGPRTTAPESAKLEPWHGQSSVRRPCRDR